MLNPKQKRFVDEYLVDLNGAAAAVRAGYSPGCAKVTASRLLTRANVREALRERGEAIAEEFRMSRRRAVGGLLGAVDLARDRQDPAAMIAAWREIGRMCGYYATEREPAEVPVSTKGIRARLRAMSDEELRALAAGVG